MVLQRWLEEQKTVKAFGWGGCERDPDEHPANSTPLVKLSFCLVCQSLQLVVISLVGFSMLRSILIISSHIFLDFSFSIFTFECLVLLYSGDQSSSSSITCLNQHNLLSRKLHSSLLMHIFPLRSFVLCHSRTLTLHL